MHFHISDLVIIGFLAIMIIRGFFKGFFVQTFQILKWGMASFLSFYFSPSAAKLMRSYFDTDSLLTEMIAWWGIFFISMMLLQALIELANRYITGEGDWINSILGGIMGGVFGYGILIISVGGIDIFFPRQKWPVDWQDAYALTYVYRHSVQGWHLIQPWLPDLKQIADKKAIA